MKNHEWAKNIAEYSPMGQEKGKGKKKRKGRDDIEQIVGSAWTQKAQNRWRSR